MKRRTVLNAAWAAPVIALAVAAPVRASSDTPVEIAWASSAIEFDTSVLLRVTIPVGSSAIGMSGYLDVAPDPTSTVAYVWTEVTPPWPGSYPDGSFVQSYYPGVPFAAGTYDFTVSFGARNTPFVAVAYTATLLDLDSSPLSDAVTVTIVS